MRRRPDEPKPRTRPRMWVAEATRVMRGWLSRSDGATTTEYALILALVVVILIGTLTALGQALQDKLELIIEKIRASA